MKKFTIVLLTSFLFFNSFISAYSAPLADSTDELTINLPRASSTISGTSTITFKLYDDENPTPVYDVALYQPNCTSKVGTIVSNNHSIKSSTNIYTTTWNTDGPILDLASIPNGTYCFKVCATFSYNNQSDYAVCDARPLTLADQVNRAPVITSSPPNNTYLIGQTYGYNVIASDPDGDSITFSLQNAPGFLLINNQTGAISTNGTLDQAGVFSFLIVVTDSKGAKSTQSITITVVEAPTKELTSIKILEPNKDSIFSGTNNIIKWEIKNITEIKDFGLFYSTNGDKWISIAKPNAKDSQYNWNVSALETGNYFVKAVVQDQSDEYFESISEEFSIISTEDSQKESSVGLKSLLPEPDSIVKEFKEISAIIIPSQGASVSIDKIKLVLDDQDITNKCEIVENKLVCNIEDLEVNDGQHKITLDVEDSKGQKASQTWNFTLDTQSSSSVVEKDPKSTSILLILGIICCLAFLLILIPWILYTLWKRRNDDDKYTQEDYYVDNNEPSLDPTSEITTNYYQPTTENTITTPAEDELTFDENDYVIQETELSGNSQPQNTQTSTTPVIDQTIQVNQPTPTIDTNTTKLDTTGDNELTEEDIPDWLKTDDDSASAPVSVAGGNVEEIKQTKQTQQDMTGAEPYDDYGLASKDSN